MSIKKKVPISHAVALLRDDIANYDSSLEPIFKVWGKQAEEAIDSFTQYQRHIYVLDIHDCSSCELPCEVVAVSGLILGDYGCECNKIFSKAYGLTNSIGANISTLNGFIVVAPTLDPCMSNMKYVLQDNKIIFAGNYDGKQVTVDTLRYQVDCDGWMMINENHLRAIAAFIEYKYMRRFNHKKGIGSYTMAEINKAEDEWNRLCRQARGEDNRPTESEWAEIVTLWNDPLSGIQNTLWNTTNGYYKTIGGALGY